jgi:drug/metabolite transporter superfamily protein YnfA
MIVFVVANLANFASFAFAAQSLLAALGSIQFVSNVAFARLVNKERITPHTVVGTLIIVAGCVTLVLFGPHDSPSYTVDELMALYGNAAYISYLCVGAAVVIGSYIAYWWIKRRRQTRVLGLYVLFSAIVGTQSVLYGKSLSLLFRASLAGTNVVKSWYSWACLLAFLVAAFYWVRRFNKGLRYFDVMRAMPAMQVGWILFSLVSGGLYFQEFRGFTVRTWRVGWGGQRGAKRPGVHPTPSNRELSSDRVGWTGTHTRILPLLLRGLAPRDASRRRVVVGMNNDGSGLVWGDTDTHTSSTHSLTPPSTPPLFRVCSGACLRWALPG